MRSMPAAPSSPFVSHSRWPWMVTSRGATSWKSASNVVFVEGTITPMRLRRLMRSPPVVDLHGLLIVAAHDAPVAVGLAAHHHDVNVLAPEHRDQLVRPGLQLGRPRLLAERGARVNVVLHELVVPVLAGRHESVIVQPVEQRILLREAAAVDELPRGDRIEQQRGRT